MNFPFLSERSSDEIKPIRRPALRARSEMARLSSKWTVAVLLLSIAMTMTVIIVGVLTKNVAATANTGTSADAAQSAIQMLASYVSGAVPPVSAASAELSPYSTSQTTAPMSPVLGRFQCHNRRRDHKLRVAVRYHRYQHHPGQRDRRCDLRP